MTPLLKLTSDNKRVLIIRLIDFNPNNIIIDDALTVFTMVYDSSVISLDEDGQLANGEIVIFDLKGLTARHLATMGLSTLRCFVKYMIDAHPIRITQVHLLNTNSILDKLMMIIKPFLGAKAAKVIHFHQPGSTALYDFVSKDVLPIEYDGTFGSMDTPKWYWIHRTEEQRDYLLDDDRWKIKTKTSMEVSQPLEESFNYLGFC